MSYFAVGISFPLISRSLSVLCRSGWFFFFTLHLCWFLSECHGAASVRSRCCTFSHSSCRAACRACSPALRHLQLGVKFTFSTLLFHSVSVHLSGSQRRRNTACAPQYRPLLHYQFVLYEQRTVSSCAAELIRTSVIS